MMSEAPLISVVIPVWNRPDDIRRCLSAVYAQSLPRDLYEVIVVDNGSTDDTVGVVRSFTDTSLLVETQPGSYAARNRGIAAAKGEYVAFTDSDCTPDAGWLAAGLDTIRATQDCGVTGGPIELYVVDGADAVATAFDQLFAFDVPGRIASNSCLTANWMSPLSAIRDLGGFNSALKSGGDVDLSRRIAAAGLKIVYSKGMKVRHPARGTFNDHAQKVRRVVGGRMQKSAKRSMLYWFAQMTREMAGQCKRAFRSEIPSMLKLNVMKMAVGLWVVALLEIARLSGGGVPYRQ